MTEQDATKDAAQEKAAIKIQAMARGRQARSVLSNNSLDGARAIFAERQAMRDRSDIVYLFVDSVFYGHVAAMFFLFPLHPKKDEQTSFASCYFD
jgi:hypothetical protein